MIQEKSLSRAVSGKVVSVDFSGLWQNELKSTATLSQTGDVISGRYESAVSSTGQKTNGDLQGYVNGDLIAFVVHWDQFQAITAWVGQVDPNNPKLLNTLWQMTKQVPSGDEWASINTGYDFFTKQ